MPEDIRSMQQDAIRRAREMYRRAMPTPRQATKEVTNSPEAQPQQDNKPIATPDSLEQNSPPDLNAEDGELTQDFIETFFKDNEKMMIIALLVMLSGEDCDNSLLFALMFLLL